MQIRAETENDKTSVRTLHECAFATSLEAKLVDALRAQTQPLISLVADEGGAIAGHILFSPVVLDECPELRIMGLAPLAVAPERQRQGIGSALVREGLARCRKLGIGAVVVLGHPDYYSRFGFLPSTRFGIKSEYDVPEDVFMITELRPDYLGGAKGTIRYHAAFSNA